MAEQRVTQDITQVEYDQGSPSQKVTQAVVQVEHVGGYGEPAQSQVTQELTQIEYDQSTNAKMKLTQCIVQVEYQESYPNIPLQGYAPRILIDMYLAGGVERFSTVDTVIEELS